MNRCMICHKELPAGSPYSIRHEAGYIIGEYNANYTKVIGLLCVPCAIKIETEKAIHEDSSSNEHDHNPT